MEWKKRETEFLDQRMLDNFDFLMSWKETKVKRVS